MTTLVTGGTGLIGERLVHQLVARGEPVRVLVRDRDRAGRMLPKEAELVLGDITEPRRSRPRPHRRTVPRGR